MASESTAKLIIFAWVKLLMRRGANHITIDYYRNQGVLASKGQPMELGTSLIDTSVCVVFAARVQHELLHIGLQ